MRCTLALALLLLTTAPAGAESSLRRAGDDLVLQLDAAPGDFRLERDHSVLRIILPPGGDRPDLSVPEGPLDLVTRVEWVDVEGGGSALELSMGAGLIKAVESGPGGLRVVFAATVQAKEDYIIGPRDVLSIDVFGETDLTGQVTVDPAGDIDVSWVGVLHAAGRTADDLAQVIRYALERDFLENPQVRVDVVEYRSHTVSIFGPVVKPGNISVLGPTPLSRVLRLALGFSDKAGYHLTVQRRLPDGGFHSFRVSREALEAGLEDPLILPEDLIQVADADYFFIDGEVTRPSLYSLMPGLTLMKAIALAAGTTPWANEGEIEIHRQVGGQTILEQYNLKKIRAHKTPDPVLRPGDLVVVPRRFL